MPEPELPRCRFTQGSQSPAADDTAPRPQAAPGRHHGAGGGESTNAMQPTLDWGDVLLRLGLTLCAGAVIGANRGEHGKPAGLRITILVCLAASLAMLLANLLLPTAGRPSNSFVQMDVMGLPLGILTGMGFIGGGTILRRDDIVVGVTTAATLWLVTVIGLCIGAGQIALGSLATALGLVVVWGLEIVERHLPQMRRATLVLTALADASDLSELLGRIKSSGYAVTIRSLSFTEAAKPASICGGCSPRARSDRLISCPNSPAMRRSCRCAGARLRDDQRQGGGVRSPRFACTRLIWRPAPPAGTAWK